MLTRLLTILKKLEKVLSSEKLWTDTFYRKKKKPLKNILNKIGAIMEPSGTPDTSVLKLLSLLLIFKHCLQF